jgi:hypothetical protein
MRCLERSSLQSGLLVVLATRYKVPVARGWDAAYRGRANMDDEGVEQAIRAVLTPLNRRFSRFCEVDKYGALQPSGAVIAITLLVTVAATILGAGVHWGLDLRGQPRSAVVVFYVLLVLLSLPIGLSAGMVALPQVVGHLMIRGPASEFVRRFPSGAAELPIAVRILSEMETPSRVERRLQDAIKRISR